MSHSQPKPTCTVANQLNPDSFLAAEYPWADYEIKDTYERTRDEYIRRWAYERGLRALSKDLFIPIDRAAEKRGIERWKIINELEAGKSDDPTLISNYLASRVLSMTEILSKRETQELLFAIDERFPAEAKVGLDLDQARIQAERRGGPQPVIYKLPVQVAYQIKERIKQTTDAPEVIATDTLLNKSTLWVRFGEKQKGWMEPHVWLKRIVYEVVYIDAFDQVQAIIQQQAKP